ncbi:hypothetical protein B0J11DRAFT_232356 [Dendryphion nanum]|uniref:Uncharacterized protein n=1 Tax=Dendryphion nanum TaxID=256645 RepID=A0A9P9E8K7_9PLEO|nr:hypothetical protein B0J11DRAFT_232356 [Dendryphion nanum]
MPLCVARQCNVWGVSRSAARPLQSTISTQWRRAYSIQPIEGGEQGAVLRKPKSAIIIPRSVAVSPDDLIKHIKPLEIHEYRNYRFALFLLTPSFAQWLLEGNTFLEKAVHQAFSPVLQSTAFAKVHAFAAVVDKLPSPQAIHEPPQWGLPRDRSSPPNVDNELGNEGLAYKFLRPHNVVRSAHRSNMDEKGSISFILSEASDGRVETSRLIRLPLANTVFQTGAHSTMALSTWEKPKNRQELAIVSKSELIHQEFRLDSSKAVSQDTVFSIPLVPLTMPRVVDAAMGNILRRVIGSDGKVITASEELEKAVPQYFKSRDEPSQSISVWALVIPNNMRELVNNDFHRLVAEIQLDEGKSNSGVTTDIWAQLWKNGGRTWSPLVVNALNAGCRLYRVLSGGGGWGKKAGLLSLDPAFNNEELEGPTVAATPINLQGLDEISSALRQVVKPGELIQFFTSSSVAKVYEQSSEDIPEDLKKLESLYTPWTGEYGTIPSTVDALQSNSWQHAVSNEGRSGESFVFLDNFGALSEGGMTFRVQERIITPDSIATVNGCKIDVPFSWLGTREESHDPNAIATTNGKRAVPDERVRP